ncbi:4-oxalocrotonate tautomerase family protein [Campylobacter fetus subsp. venerealis]|uniref:tautomerase family protein n=1 Tax=Campylobacter fetus TaxID=196 RepID=UPI0018E8C3C6|nr:4-oxalocrotonate tautomerase family protein [Campylobacter fetus]QQF52833.1 4-oxalocrotonate tautomerase family protein [Campylobacter fetus subsp. venerealis]
MPIINIKLTAPMPSREKLDEIAVKITDIMVKDLGKNPDRVVINFDEIRPEATYFGAKSVQTIKEGK